MQLVHQIGCSDSQRYICARTVDQTFATADDLAWITFSNRENRQTVRALSNLVYVESSGY
jgi:hypothetical protein